MGNYFSATNESSQAFRNDLERELLIRDFDLIDEEGDGFMVNGKGMTEMQKKLLKVIQECLVEREVPTDLEGMRLSIIEMQRQQRMVLLSVLELLTGVEQEVEKNEEVVVVVDCEQEGSEEDSDFEVIVTQPTRPRDALWESLKALFEAHFEEADCSVLADEWMNVFQDDRDQLSFIIQEYSFLVQHEKLYDKPKKVKTRVEFWECNLFSKIKDDTLRNDIRYKRSGTIMNCTDKTEAMNVINRTFQKLDREKRQKKQSKQNTHLHSQLQLELSAFFKSITNSEPEDPSTESSSDW